MSHTRTPNVYTLDIYHGQRNSFPISFGYLGCDMTEASIFSNNKNQAIRLPKALEFSGDVKKVNIISVGNARIITPVGESWDSWFDGLSVSEDYFLVRDQPDEQERESF